MKRASKTREWNTVWIFLLSLALGMIIWADGVRESDPLGKRQLTVPLELIQKPGAVLLDREDLNTVVEVAIEAPNTLLNTLNSSNFEAVLDLSAAEFGDTEVPIQVRLVDEVAYSQVEINDYFPNIVSVNMDQRIEKTLPVTVEVRGSAAEGFDLEQWSADPESVTLTGPSSRVNAIVEARTDVFLDIPRDTITRNRPIQFYNSQGVVVALGTDISATSNGVLVTVPVVELPGYKTVVIRANQVGSPNENYLRAGVDVSPSTIVVNGPPELIADLVSVQTTEINVEDLRASQSYNVDVILPEGVSRVDQSQIEVDVAIRPIEEPREFVLTPQIVGVDEKVFEARLAQSNASIVLFGPREILNNLDTSELLVTLDLSELGAGIHEIGVAVDIPIQGVAVSSIQPEVLTVELVAIEPTPTRTPRPTATPIPTETPSLDETATPEA